MFCAVNTCSWLCTVTCEFLLRQILHLKIFSNAFYVVLNSLWFFVTKMTTCVILLSTAGMQANDCRRHQEFQHFQQHHYGCKCKCFHHKAELSVLGHDVPSISCLDWISQGKPCGYIRQLEKHLILILSMRINGP